MGGGGSSTYCLVELDTNTLLILQLFVGARAHPSNGAVTFGVISTKVRAHPVSNLYRWCKEVRKI